MKYDYMIQFLDEKGDGLVQSPLGMNLDQRMGAQN